MKTTPAILLATLLVSCALVANCPAQGELTTKKLKPVHSEEGTFVEENGIVAIEMENNVFPADWLIEQSQSGYSGTGYIQYRGEDSHPAPGDTRITYPIKITKTGTYEFSWRARNGATAEARDKENDTWLNIEADEFFGMKQDKKYQIGEHFAKAWVHSLENWKWQAAGEMHFKVDGEDKKVNILTLFASFKKPGIYRVTIAGRSKGHMIDRMVMWHSSVSEKDAKADSAPQSRITK